MSTASTHPARIHLHAHFYVAGVLLLLASIGFNYWLEQVNRLKDANLAVPLKQPLSTISRELGDYMATEDIKLSREVESMAGVSDYMNRIYVKKNLAGSTKTASKKPDEKQPGLHVYLAYWGGIRTIAPHRPTICMRGAGWIIASAHRRELEVSLAGGVEKVGVNVHVFSKDYDRQMVVWWDYIHGRNVSSPIMERLRWVLPIFMGGKAGSVVQVQISKDIESGESEESVYQTITEFATVLAPEVGKCLPEAK